MWKIVLAFVVFAALAMWMLSKGGNVDMGGEKHGIEVAEPAASVPALAPPVAASAASQ